ncbi:hypothetical protein PR048_000404 [Dryococelus australis]|uniref:Uncharacterized protein n=1 Tax=Dryococelus australis TaxID=614101 RepID=A0ABQ9IEK2_9NEOP|nr:hypothetical protein PR048_000404 [Dryococelus australis]
MMIGRTTIVSRLRRVRTSKSSNDLLRRFLHPPREPDFRKVELDHELTIHGSGRLLGGLCSCASKVKKRGSDKGDTPECKGRGNGRSPRKNPPASGNPPARSQMLRYESEPRREWKPVRQGGRRNTVTPCAHECGVLSLRCNLPGLVKLSLYEAEEHPAPTNRGAEKRRFTQAPPGGPGLATLSTHEKSRTGTSEEGVAEAWSSRGSCKRLAGPVPDVAESRRLKIIARRVLRPTPAIYDPPATGLVVERHGSFLRPVAYTWLPWPRAHGATAATKSRSPRCSAIVALLHLLGLPMIRPVHTRQSRGPTCKKSLKTREHLQYIELKTHSNQHPCHHRALTGTGTVNKLPLWELTMPSWIVNIRWLYQYDQLDLTASTGTMNKHLILYHDRLNIMVMQPIEMLHNHLKARGNVMEYSAAQNAPTLQVEVVESHGSKSRQNAPTPSSGHMEPRGNPPIRVSGNLAGQQATTPHEMHCNDSWELLDLRALNLYQLNLWKPQNLRYKHAMSESVPQNRVYPVPSSFSLFTTFPIFYEVPTNRLVSSTSMMLQELYLYAACRESRLTVIRIAPSLLDLGRAGLSQKFFLFRSFEAEKRGSDKGETATRIECAIAAKRKALNWRTRFGRLLTTWSRESTRVKRDVNGAAPECKSWETGESRKKKKKKKKPRRQAATYSTIPTFENPGVTLAGIESLFAMLGGDATGDLRICRGGAGARTQTPRLQVGRPIPELWGQDTTLLPYINNPTWLTIGRRGPPALNFAWNLASTKLQGHSVHSHYHVTAARVPRKGEPAFDAHETIALIHLLSHSPR